MHCLLCKFGDGVEVEARYIIHGTSACEKHAKWINNKFNFIIGHYRGEYDPGLGFKIPE